MPTPGEALQELLEMSASVRHAIIVRGEDDVLASTFAGGSESGTVKLARAILEEAREAGRDMDRPPLSQLFVETNSGCLFVVAGQDDTWLAATTGPDPTVGLVLYDANTALKTALEGAAGDDVPDDAPEGDSGGEQDG